MMVMFAQHITSTHCCVIDKWPAKFKSRRNREKQFTVSLYKAFPESGRVSRNPERKM